MNVLLVISLLYNIACCTIYYVNPSNPNQSGDGKSWDASFLNLSDALATVNGKDEIWLIGDSTYTPSTTIRSNCFNVQNGIKIYGGFSGTETSINERATDGSYPSIISGDIGLRNYKYDNCYHVITYSRRLSLDGLIITGGYADLEEYSDINDATLHKYGGALITADISDKTELSLNNVQFINNSAINGGALWFTKSTSNVMITNCIFRGNKAFIAQYEGGYGGVIYEYFLANISVFNTQFIDNSADSKGGAVYIDYGGIFSCNQCIFDNNNANGYGGALFAEDRSSQTEGTFPLIKDSVFQNNHAVIFGGAACIYNEAIATFINVLFNNNLCDLYGGAVALISAGIDSAASVNNTYSNNIANGNSSSNDIYDQPKIQWNNLDTSLSYNITDELIQIKNVYDNIYPVTDIYPVSDVDGTIICYVKQFNSNSNLDGSSWDTAYVELQECLDTIWNSRNGEGGEIWVQSGTYIPSIVPDWKIANGKTGRKYKSFVLYPNIRIYGGFVGTESDRNERDFAANPTFLSCKLSNTYCLQMVIAADNTIIDGFVFKESGRITTTTTTRRRRLGTSVEEVLASQTTSAGAGILSKSTNMIVVNSIFLQLYSSGKGGAVYCIGQNQTGDVYSVQSPIFINVAFLGNRAKSRGGAISADVKCNFQCNYCVFDGNSASGKGGAVYCDFNVDPVITHSIFRNNMATKGGGCIAADGGSKVKFIDTEFINNSALWEGGCLYSGSGTTTGSNRGFNIYDGSFKHNYIINNAPGAKDIYFWPYSVLKINSSYRGVPNFVIVILDDVAFTTSWNRSSPGTQLNGKTITYLDIPTPNINRIRDEGILLTRSYAAGCKCAPSRFATLTGRYPSQSVYGVSKTLSKTDGFQGTDVTVPYSKITSTDNIYNIPQVLRNNTDYPYYTGMMGKWHLTSGNDNGYNYGCNALLTTQNASLYEKCTNIMKEAGFDVVDAMYIDNIQTNPYFSHNLEWMVQESQRFINESIERDQPFFLYFATTLSHAPKCSTALLNFSCSSTPKGELTGSDIPINTGMDTRHNIWNKATNISTNDLDLVAGLMWIDDALGALIRYMEDMDVFDNTFIVVMMDHGKGAKGLLYEQGSRILQYIRYPQLFGTNGYILPNDFITSNVDLAAVIFELAQIDIVNDHRDYKMDSISWLNDVLLYIADTHNTINYDIHPPPCCKYRYSDICNSHAVISRDYKYIFRGSYEYDPTGETLTYYTYLNDTEQLYDLHSDPGEQSNIIGLNKNITFDFQYLMLQHINNSACHVPNFQDCKQPNITYIRPGSGYQPVTPAPTLSGMTCDSVVYFTKKWVKIRRFDENRAGPLKLSDGEIALKIQHPECDSVYPADLEYAYNFTHIVRKLYLSMIVCCPPGTTFGEYWIIPDGYTPNDILASFIDDDIDEKAASSNFGAKEIIVFNMIGLIVLCCCIGAFIYYYTRRKRKKLHAEMAKLNIKKQRDDHYQVPSATNSQRPSIVIIRKQYEDNPIHIHSSNKNAPLPPAVAMAAIKDNYYDGIQDNSSSSTTPMQSHTVSRSNSSDLQEFFTVETAQSLHSKVHGPRPPPSGLNKASSPIEEEEIVIGYHNVNQ